MIRNRPRPNHRHFRILWKKQSRQCGRLPFMHWGLGLFPARQVFSNRSPQKTGRAGHRSQPASDSQHPNPARQGLNRPTRVTFKRSIPAEGHRRASPELAPQRSPFDPHRPYEKAGGELSLGLATTEILISIWKVPNTTDVDGLIGGDRNRQSPEIHDPQCKREGRDKKF